MKALVPSTDPDLLVEIGVRDEPSPRPGEVVVEVAAFSINRGELFLLQKPRKDLRPGKDIAGRVVTAAQDGSGPVVGTRVVAHPPMAGWAERVAVATDALAPIPDAMSFETAAAIPLAGLTALRLVNAAGSLIGRRVLITGASGGVGHYVVELASQAGASVTAVSRTARDSLSRLGADEVVADVSEATGPFDVVMESVGGTSTTTALRVLARRGLFIWFGSVSKEPAPLYFFDFFSGPESATIRHFHYADVDHSDAQDLSTLIDLVDKGLLHPHIAAVEDWSDTPKLLAAMTSRSLPGKAIGVVRM